MLLAGDKTLIGGKGIQSTSNFRIEASAKAFNILSKNLYKDSVRAVIRELSTNAVDAHIEAGTTDIPFEVTLPTYDNLNFSIRDFGTGMSQEKVETLYSTYFGSDKNDSNEFTGCLGLGSKSPFAYTQSFTITSYYQGKKYIYVATTGSEGIPQINLLHTEVTNEPNGVEISFAVKYEDVDKFEEKATLVYEYFKRQPIIHGTELEFEDRNIFFEGKGWRVLGSGVKTAALMGNIAYPIDNSQLKQKNVEVNEIPANAPARYRQPEGIPTNYSDLLRCGVQIDFNIGDLEVTPSREELHYTDATIQCIQQKLDVILAEIVRLVNERISTAPNYFEACRTYISLLSNELNSLNGVIRSANLEYKGRKLLQYVDWYEKDKPIEGVEILHLRKNGYSDKIKKNTVGHHLDFETILYVEQDIPTTAHSRLRHRLLKSEQSISAYLIKFETTEAKKKFIEKVGFDASYLIGASSFPKPDRISYAVTKEKVFSLKGDGYHGKYWKAYWEPQDIVMEDGGVYVEINRYVPQVDGSVYPKEITPYELSQQLEQLCKLGIEVPTIVGVKTAIVNKFNDYSDAEWLNYFVWRKEVLKNFIVASNFEQIVADVYSLKTFGNSHKYESVDVKKKDGLFGQFVAKVEGLKTIYAANSQKVDILIDLARQCGYNEGVGVSTTPACDLKAEEKLVLERYPFLKFRDNWYGEYAVIVGKLIDELDARP